MADPRNRGYKLELEPTDDPDVIRVLETDDVDGPALARNVSAVEAAHLAAAQTRHPAAKNAPAKKAAAKKAAK